MALTAYPSANVTIPAVAVVNHVNIIAPAKPDLAVALEYVFAFLRSTAADEIFRCMSGSISVSATELQAMPLPRPIL
ncbi:hypothetical protein GI582_24380 [Sulfitobacter sp. BDSS02]|uniref:hypothetical protein n=1 Tax=Heliomarina sp. TaxID=2917556 RepID=UPI004058252E|nr:hypothetical protein [Sulfitobacter sp. BDSS02]MBR9852437.1 hypothetical protein [Paracoccaceae bacterium]